MVLRFSTDSALCWRTWCSQLLQPQSPVSVCAANSLLQPLSGSQTQNISRKTLRFHTICPKSLREQLKPPFMMAACSIWLSGSNSWGPRNSHCGAKSEFTDATNFDFIHPSMSNACSSRDLHCWSCGGERDKKASCGYLAFKWLK